MSVTLGQGQKALKGRIAGFRLVDAYPISVYSLIGVFISAYRVYFSIGNVLE